MPYVNSGPSSVVKMVSKWRYEQYTPFVLNVILKNEACLAETHGALNPDVSNADGTVSSAPPLVRRVQNFFWGVINFLTLFLRTLTSPALNGRGNQQVTDYRRPGSGGGPPPPPSKRLGGFKTLSDCKSAPMPGGG